MILTHKFFLKIIIILFIFISNFFLISSFFFIKEKEGFDERKYKDHRRRDFYQPSDFDMIATNAGISAAIYAAIALAWITFGASLAAIPFLLEQIINVYDARSEGILHREVITVEDEIAYDKSQLPIVDNSINIVSSGVNGYATQIKTYSKRLEKQIEKMNTQLPVIFSSNALLNKDPNVSMIGNIHANLRDIRVYLNMIINETVLSNMKKDLKDDKKMNDIFGYLGSLTKNINSKLIHVNKMIIAYVPKIIPKSTPNEIKTILKDLNNMKPNLTKILNNIELINKVMTYFMSLVFLKKFFLTEIAENQKLNDTSLQPFKRKRYKNARW